MFPVWLFNSFNPALFDLFFKVWLENKFPYLKHLLLHLLCNIQLTLWIFYQYHIFSYYHFITNLEIGRLVPLILVFFFKITLVTYKETEKEWVTQTNCFTYIHLLPVYLNSGPQTFWARTIHFNSGSLQGVSALSIRKILPFLIISAHEQWSDCIKPNHTPKIVLNGLEKGSSLSTSERKFIPG